MKPLPALIIAIALPLVLLLASVQVAKVQFQDYIDEGNCISLLVSDGIERSSIATNHGTCYIK